MQHLLTLQHAAQICAVSTKTVLRAIHAGDLKASRLGKRGAYRVQQADLVQWVHSKTVQPERETLERSVAEPLISFDFPPDYRSAESGLLEIP